MARRAVVLCGVPIAAQASILVGLTRSSDTAQAALVALPNSRHRFGAPILIRTKTSASPAHGAQYLGPHAILRVKTTVSQRLLLLLLLSFF